MLFSLFPFLIFLIALLGFLELTAWFDWLRDQFQHYFLQQTVYQLNQVLNQLQQRRLGLLSVGVITSILAASHGMYAMMKALNVVYRVKESRPLWKRYSLAVLSTLAAGTMIAVSLTLVLATPQALELLAKQFGMGSGDAVFWAWRLRWPVILALLTIALAVIYGVTPNVDQRIRFVTPGALFAVLLWIGSSVGFNYYVQSLGRYNALYGSVGTLIVLLVYAYLSTAIFLFGAEINAVIEHHAPTGKNAGESSLPSDDVRN